MTDEERRIITTFVERMAGVQQQQQAAGPWGGSVPSTGQARPPLPPIDREADALIQEMFNRYPEARYRITQTAFVQEAALVEAQNRIQQLEWELEAARRQAGAAQQNAQRGGLFGGMFGGGRPASPPPMPPRPQPHYPPGYNPQAMQAASRGGSGFLATAATTAAGVAGGMLLGNMLMSAFSGGGAAQAAGLGAGAFGQEAVPSSSPWTDPTGAQAANAGGMGGQDAQPDDAQAADYGDDAAGFDEGGGFDEEI